MSEIVFWFARHSVMSKQINCTTIEARICAKVFRMQNIWDVCQHAAAKHIAPEWVTIGVSRCIRKCCPKMLQPNCMHPPVITPWLCCGVAAARKTRFSVRLVVRSTPRFEEVVQVCLRRPPYTIISTREWLPSISKRWALLVGFPVDIFARPHTLIQSSEAPDHSSPDYVQCFTAVFALA